MSDIKIESLDEQELKEENASTPETTSSPDGVGESAEISQASETIGSPDTDNISTETSPENNSTRLEDDGGEDEEDFDPDYIEDSPFGKLKHQNIVTEMEHAYLDYAMSVIVAPAPPPPPARRGPRARRVRWSQAPPRHQF